MKNEELNNIIKLSYPEIVADQLCSVQHIDASMFKNLFFQSEEEKQAYYDSLPQWIKDIKHVFNKGDLFFSYYDDKNHIGWLNYNKHFNNDKNNEEIFTECNLIITIVDEYCKNHNLEFKSEISKIHDFFKGWFKELQFEIKEKYE